MTKLARNPALDKLYNNMTKTKLASLMENIQVLNCALAHLAYVCQKEKDKGILQIPLIEHQDCTFNFHIMEHKVTKERVLTVEVEELKTDESVH